MRKLDTDTLDMAARDYGGHFLLPTVPSKKNPGTAIGGHDWVMQNIFNVHFKDEHEYLLQRVRDTLGPGTVKHFDKEAASMFSPRSDQVFKQLLAERLACDENGKHIPGKVGTVVMGARTVGMRITRHGMRVATWRVYAGEEEERLLGHVREKGGAGPGCDPIPPEDTIWPSEDAHLGAPTVMMALNTNVSIEFAQAGINASLDLFDEGSVDGVLEGRTGSQPVDPNAAVTGTLLFGLDMGTPGFGAAADGAPGADATAAAVADDTSADATATLSYVRASSANTLVTPLNDHIDGEAGTSGADFNFNTLAIVSGATVSLTSWIVTQPQGPSAT